MRQITVGIPVFNAMPYLPRTLESILRQDYSDFEILVINDGSTDDSRQYLDSIRDPRLRIVDQENRGVTEARNRMLAEVRTPWLALNDADDIAYPRRLACAADYICRYPESGMFYSLAEYYPVVSGGRFRSTINNPSEIRDFLQLGYLPSVCNSTAILNVERTKAVGGYQFNLYGVEDADLWWRIALHYDMRIIPEVLTGYRMSAQSLTSVNLEEQALSALYVQYRLISHLWGRKPLVYRDVRAALLQLFSRKKVTFRKHLRAFNMELGDGNRNRAFLQAAKAFFASPADFISRLLDEYVPHRAITNGEPPALFKKHENILWPKHAEHYYAPFEPPAALADCGLRIRQSSFHSSQCCKDASAQAR